MMELINTIYVTYTVQLIDVNDNTPMCGNFTGSVTESTVNVRILQVMAMDIDGGGAQPILFMIEPSNDSIPFDVTSGNGELFNRLSLDLEVQEFYRFTVLAIDQGISPARIGRCPVSLRN